MYNSGAENNDIFSLTKTSNNQRLEYGRQRSKVKRFCSNAVSALRRFLMAKTCMIRLPGVEGRNARDKSAFCAFHSFLVEFQTKAGYIHATHA